MWIVRLALRRPYTFTVIALVIMVVGGLSALSMPKDILPSIDIPVVSAVYQYNGLTADEMEKRIITGAERVLTTTVNNVEHMESQSYFGVGVIKIFFHPGTSIDAAVSQVTATAQSVVRQQPAGTTPPQVLRYSATNVPVLQLAVASKTLSEQTVFDLAQNVMRTQLATVQGASLPLPAGGKQREIVIDLNPRTLAGYGISPGEVSRAIGSQNLILPAGTAKVGDREYGVHLNSSMAQSATFGDIPIKTLNGRIVYVRDVAQVRDAFAPQTNIVRKDGSRGVLVTILKNSDASTLDIIRRVRNVLPRIKKLVPDALEIEPEFDQSIFVRAALDGVVREGLIAAALTAAMILLFLGTWRTTLVVAVSIPLSVGCSLLCLYSLGETLNVMTLGGLSLAVGILVDDATVEIENVSRNLAAGKPLFDAILDGAQQIAMPAFVSTLCICIVFAPIFFLAGVAKYLFTPLALAVVFAVMASYFLSRTVVPTFVYFLLRGGHYRHEEDAVTTQAGGNLFWRIHVGFNRAFFRFRAQYVRALSWCLGHRAVVISGMVGALLLALALLPFLGRDFFPAVDAAQFRLHVRAPAGTRIEETERIFTRVEQVIREVIPAQNLVTIVDNIGLPVSSLRISLGDLATIGPSDGEILVQLNAKKSIPTADYVRVLRRRLGREFPDCTFFTQAADIVSQILNFGRVAPIDIQIAGRDAAKDYTLAQELSQRMARLPGAVGVHVHEIPYAPYFDVEVDRIRAESVGLTQEIVANDVLTSLAGTAQTLPTFWLDPATGFQYPVITQSPQYRIDSPQSIMETPVGAAGRGAAPQMLANVAKIGRSSRPGNISHYNMQSVFNIYGSADGTDLGSVGDGVRKLVEEFRAKLPRGSFISVRGEMTNMEESFHGLEIGLLFAIGLVYLLLVVNFQSWLDPMIIILALPGAFCGIIWMLFLTRTTLSVPSLMGAIMSMGVATANSILVVTFANDERKEGKSAAEAALAAGSTRLRPVLMTALAMIIGMLPMSLGMGEGGEQNAPLGRAVIGGLLIATVATLLFVPVAYAALRKTIVRRS